MNWVVAFLVSIVGIAFIGILANVSDSASTSLTTTSYLPSNSPNDFTETGSIWGSLTGNPLIFDSSEKVVGQQSVKIS